MSKPRIAFFLPNLHGGGAQRVGINLLKGMVDNDDFDLDLVLAIAEGPYVGQIPKEVNVIDFGVNRVIQGLIPLRNYLQTVQPTALLSHMNYVNVIALLAKRMTQSKTKIYGVEHNTLSASVPSSLSDKVGVWLMKKLYPTADKIIGVSQGVSEDLEAELGLKAGLVQTIYNPVIDRELLAKAELPAEHPWFEPGQPPVFLGVGRLTKQKDFSNLIRAFAVVRAKREAKLIILGEGELREDLEALITSLGLTEDVDLPGFISNPYGFMKKSDVFILSSLWEGLPTVLIEAMACGCVVVSTDCPSGPVEILAGGEYGGLVPIKNSQALGEGMLSALEASITQNAIKARARDFSIEYIVPQYLDLLLN